MAYDVGDKVYIITYDIVGTIIDLHKNRYEVEYDYYVTDVGEFTIRDTFMAHELLPWTEEMKLLYDE